MTLRELFTMPFVALRGRIVGCWRAYRVGDKCAAALHSLRARWARSRLDGLYRDRQFLVRHISICHDMHRLDPRFFDAELTNANAEFAELDRIIAIAESELRELLLKGSP